VGPICTHVTNPSYGNKQECHYRQQAGISLPATSRNITAGNKQECHCRQQAGVSLPATSRNITAGSKQECHCRQQAGMSLPGFSSVSQIKNIEIVHDRFFRISFKSRIT
jgi:hypothetical protein